MICILQLCTWSKPDSYWKTECTMLILWYFSEKCDLENLMSSVMRCFKRTATLEMPPCLNDLHSEWNLVEAKHSELFFTHNLSDTKCIVSFPKLLLQLSNTSGVPYSSIQFWHYLPRVSIRYHNLRTRGHKAPVQMPVASPRLSPVIWPTSYTFREVTTTKPLLRFHNLIEHSQNSGKHFTITGLL